MRITTLSNISLAAVLLLVMGVCWTAYSYAADAETTSEDDVSATLVIELDGNTEDDTEGQTTGGIIIAPEPEDDSEQAGVTELEGLWVVESFIREGESIRTQGVHWQFEGNTFAILFGERGFIETVDIDVIGEFSMVPSAMPAQIDIDSTTHTSMVETKGIYKLDDDLLTICFYPTQGEIRSVRPDRFESTDEHRTWLWEIRRVTEEDVE